MCEATITFGILNQKALTEPKVRQRELERHTRIRRRAVLAEFGSPPLSLLAFRTNRHSGGGKKICDEKAVSSLFMCRREFAVGEAAKYVPPKKDLNAWDVMATLNV